MNPETKEPIIIFDTKTGLDFVEIFMISPSYIFGRPRNYEGKISKCPGIHLSKTYIVKSSVYNTGVDDSSIIKNLNEYIKEGISFKVMDSKGKILVDSESENPENPTIYQDIDFESRYGIFMGLAKAQENGEIDIEKFLGINQEEIDNNEEPN